MLAGGTNFLTTMSAEAKSVSVTGVRIGETNKKTRLVLELSERVNFNVFTLANPYRVVIDFDELDWKIGQGGDKGRGYISRYRYGLFKPGTSRLVLDIDRPVKVSKSFFIAANHKYPDRFVLDLEKTNHQTFVKNTRKPVAVTRSSSSASPVAAFDPSFSGKAKRTKKVIVIDAGHGGVDPGAPGAAGKPEKKITLEVARAIRHALVSTGRYKVVMTRDRDLFIPLRKRVDIARAHDADLFLSVHADSLDNKKVRGATVYTLSETASDKEAAKLAAKENKADIIAGIDLGTETDDVSGILIDLVQRETMNYSVRFADVLVGQLKGKVLLRTNSHRFAGFRVLKAPDVPSVLLEMGYLSNYQDAKSLGTRQTQRKLAKTVQEAIDRYFEKAYAGQLGIDG
ncbi:MAG: N-acetylmuramoyl-L-alanine amidase [Kordiimonas sp.]|nr:N-acetylmuramoyl-L-alanine amidase [Kordiimonas sp.]|tara:strand:+ start:288 stop:1484 length:1197 start_codon:yes stop_codon:yes gene_type:complete